MKIVLDTNCLVVCLPVTSPYYCLWEAFRDMRITLCYTTDIINEYSEILERFYNLRFNFVEIAGSVWRKLKRSVPSGALFLS